MAVDFETANAFPGSVCAVGLVRVTEGRIVDEWSSLIRPPAGHDHFDPWNTSIHGITEAQVADAPGWRETLKEIMAFADGDPFVAHYAPADTRFLAGACEASGVDVPDLRFACSCVIARRAWPELLSWSLPVVAGHLDIDLIHHDVLSDVRAAARIVLAALAQREVATLEELLEADQIQMGEFRDGRRRGCRHRGSTRRAPFPEADPGADPDNPFYGLTVCFTGKPGMTKRDAGKRIAALGAWTVDNLTKAVDLLVMGEVDPRQLAPGATKTGKLAKAERYREQGLDIEIIDVEQFLERLSVAEA
ncbi:exonuclease domain-containing protein [Actinomadura sp. NPDC047616]|uniref:exonuclease domain-containing protein n=1 Tax=Actinomadura sp. NPDC047616 TaxID=3155914 RepID=UPI0033E237E6